MELETARNSVPPVLRHGLTGMHNHPVGIVIPACGAAQSGHGMSATTSLHIR
ncbi:MAG: hypothetical protein OXT64_07525 [Gammaproteobacteria bacterium]|nr:hypothetical protein [Gammaproteobacteria bacterium]